MDWFYLSLLCAMSLAFADALTKKHLTGYSGWELLLVRFVVPGTLLAPLLLIFPMPAVPMVFWGWIVLLVPLELLAMLLYMQAIRDAPLYQTLPYLAFTPVFNIVTGWLILGEQVTLLGGVGILLVVLGTYLLNIDQHNQQNRAPWFEPFLAIVYQQGSRRMLAVAIIYSFTSVLSKAAMLHVGPMSFAAFYFSLLAVVTLCLVGLIRPNKIATLWRRPRWHMLIGSLMALMVVTHFLAISMVEVAYMVALKRSSLLFGILLGAYMFHEPALVKHFSAVALMVGGVALILLA